MKTPIKRNIASIAKEDAHGGAGQRQILFSRQDDVSKHFDAWTKGFLPPGASYDWHDHKNIDEFFIVLSGNGFIEYAGGRKLDYAEGDTFYNPANLSHRIVNEGGKESVFYFMRVAA